MAETREAMTGAERLRLASSSTPSGLSPNRPYLPAVDHLRALFALLVLFYHGWQLFSYRLIFDAEFRPDHWMTVRNPFLSVLVEGHTGVAAFMVLSGFIFVHGTYGHTVSYTGFLRNRLLRIYPMYLLLVVFGACVHPEQDIVLSLIRYVLPLANFGSAPFGMLPTIGWAVAVEFQFYLVFPLLLVLLERHGPGLFWRMIALLIGLRVVLVLLGNDIQPLSYWTIAGRMDQFLIGMLAGRWFARAPGQASRIGWQIVPAVLTIVAILYGFNRLGGWPASASWKALWPTIEAAAWAWFILAYIAAAVWMPLVIAAGLSAIGRISFSMYLLHFALIEVLSQHHWILRVTGNPYFDALVTTLVFALPLTLAASAFTYATIEAPFLGLRRRYVGAS